MMKKMLHIPDNMKVVILAGGKGTRLYPYTTVLPKPLVPIGDRPILEILIMQLKSAGIRNIIISVGHLAELIKAFFQNGDKWNINIEYAIEDKPLGTMGPLSLMQDLGEHFFVMNGDVCCDLDFGSFYESHINSGAIMSVATYTRQINIDFGVLRYDEVNHHIYSFEEKPDIKYDLSMGVYLLSRRCLNYIPCNEYFGFDNLILALLKNREAINSFQHSGKWLDIGRPEDYESISLEYKSFYGEK